MLRTSAEFTRQWKNYLEVVGIESKAVFIQIVTSEVFEQLLNDTYIAKTAQDEKEVQFTYEEENAIRYMAGFVVRKVQKKLDAKDVEILIESDKAAITGSSSAEWVDIIDRRGLVHVTDACYQLFLAIEHVTRRELQLSKISSMDDNFRKHLDNMLSNDDDVLFNWTMITGGETENEEVLHEIIKLWITTTGFSFKIYHGEVQR